MSKLYLSRLVDSFLKDVPKDDENKMRDIILKNKEEFDNFMRIKSKLNFTESDRDIRLLNNIILHILLDENGYICEENTLVNEVKQNEREIIEESQKEEVLKYSDPKSLHIYEKVLEAAWGWQDYISPHEQNILDVLKAELAITLYEHRVLESKMGYFPQQGNKIHGNKVINEALKDLQYRGLIVRIKDNNQYFYVIPEGIAETMREILGIELRNEVYQLLLKKLNKEQLSRILRSNKLPVSGKKEELYDRIITAQIKPSVALNVLTSEELSDFLRNLDDVNTSGTKEDKIANILDFYNNLITYSIEGSDPREVCYNYINELAHRNYEQLRGNNIIEKDLDVEHFFEEATCYLFEVLLGHAPTKMKGKDNPDGRLIFNENEVILWDNKSCENEYILPDSHFNQFLRYIQEEEKRVTLFLIIAPSFSSGCTIKAQKLKAKSERDTDVGLITAEEIKFVAENWKKYCKHEPVFNLQVFNYTGRLTKEILIQRMEWALT